MAEELPNPKVDLPKAVFAQVGLGFITSFLYGIAIFYGISDLVSRPINTKAISNRTDHSLLLLGCRHQQ